MRTRFHGALGGAVLVGAALLLPRCSLLVNLDIEQVDAGPPASCPICTSLDGGEDAAVDEAGPDAAWDANESDRAVQDAGAGE